MKFIFAIFCIYFCARGEAAIVDRLLPNDKVDRLTFIRQGLAGRLHSPEQIAQFHLLLCQPKAAWKAAEKIRDEKTKALFQGTILALTSTPRPPDADEDLDLLDPPPKSGLAIAAQFNLEQEEVWADEVPDLAVGQDCDFPIAMNRDAVTARAKKIMEQSLASEKPGDISVYALASDVGLQPVLDAKTLQLFSEQNAKSTYLPRLQFFAEYTVPGSSEAEITIKGNRARTSQLTLTDATFHAHRLEIPWLLRQ